MHPDYATITVETVLSTGATTFSFEGDISPTEETLLPIIQELAGDMWRVTTSLGSVIVVAPNTPPFFSAVQGPISSTLSVIPGASNPHL